MAQQKLQPKLKQSEHQSIVDAYDGELFHVDSLVKQLWEHFRDTDHIFIFHSDHGEAFGERGFYGHLPEHYEELIKVPLVMYNTDYGTGSVQEPVSFLGLPFTICELANINNKFSQPSLFTDSSHKPPIVVNREQDGSRITVRNKEWKLITNPDGEDELYNLRYDPMKQENLIGNHPDIERELRKKVEGYYNIRGAEEKRNKE